MKKNKERKGSGYIRVGDSEVLELRARGVTVQQFRDRYYNHFLDGPQEGHQVIRHYLEGLSEVGVFVFEGTGLDNVGIVLAEKWGLDEVRLLEKPLRIRLEMPIPEGHTDEDLFRAIVDALGKAFPNCGGEVTQIVHCTQHGT